MAKKKFIFILAGIVLGLVLLGFFILQPAIKRNQSWRGTVSHLYMRTHGDKFKTPTFHVEVKCDDGRVRQIRVNGVLWLSLKEGDRLRKLKGERQPRRIGPPDWSTSLKEEMGKDFPKELEPMVPVEE